MEARRQAFVQPTPEQVEANRKLLTEMAARPRGEQEFVQVDYLSAEPSPDDKSPNALVRREQRRLADVAERSTPGYENPLRSVFEKVFAPYRAGDGPGTVYGFSFDKLVQNVDILQGWLSENPAVKSELGLPYDLTSPQLAADVNTYLRNQSNGYGGDGSRLVRPADAVGITPENPSYTPVKLSRPVTNVINLLMGLEPAQKLTAKEEFNLRFAEANGLVPARRPKGGIEVNALRNQLRESGFDPRTLNGVLENLRIDRVGANVVRRPDLALPVGEGAFVRAGFMPRALPIPERFTGTGEEAGRRGEKATPPAFFNRYGLEGYIRGGKYVDTESGENITGRVYQTGSIDVSTGRPNFQTSDTPASLPTSGRKIRTNLFKQSAGWKWVGEAPSSTSTLVSVEIGNDHVYTLKAQFDTPVELARYTEKKSEPRLRPTTRGVLQVGEKVGEIEVRGRVHPVYDTITTATDAPGRGIVNRGEDSRQFMPAGNDDTTQVASDYVRKAFGREYVLHTTYDQVPEERLKEIADYFQNVAKHEPDSPEVQRAYQALADETIEQYKAMIDAGIEPEPYNGVGEPYASSEELIRDVRDNKHLYFLRTDGSFGQGTQGSYNPLLEKSGLKIGDFELLVNDVFRVVHDYFGHTQRGFQFGPRGELNAWKSHSRMYSDAAQGALAAEALAQNAWVNFGQHLRRDDGSIPKKGDPDYVPPQDRPFAEQKNFLVPPELIEAALGPTNRDFRFMVGETTVPEAPLAEETLPTPRGPLNPASNTAMDILYSKVPTLKAPEEGQRNGGVARMLASAALEVNGRKITSKDITTEETRRLAEVVADETEAALKEDGSAVDWYTKAIRNTLTIARSIFDELNSEEAAKAAGFPDVKSAELGLLMALAITSQNLKVSDNAKYAVEQFESLARTGRFDSTKQYGTKAPAISSNLDLANELIDRKGWLGLNEFISKSFTVGELSKTASDLLGEDIVVAGRVDDVVQGAALFGPKIGQGFLQNLLGNFDPVTVDLWLRRTWGRLTGDVIPKEVSSLQLAAWLDSFRDAGIPLPESLKTIRVVTRERPRSGKTYRDLTPDAYKRFLNSDQAREDFDALNEDRFNLWQRSYKNLRLPMEPALAQSVRNREITPETAAKKVEKVIARRNAEWQAYLEKTPRNESLKKPEFLKELDAREGRTDVLSTKELSAIKPEWAKSTAIIDKLGKPIDAPTDQDRAEITKLLRVAREILAQRGIVLTNADLQATIWYPEKDIWAKLRGDPDAEKLKSSYDTEFLKIADSRGRGDAARTAVRESRTD